MLHVNFHPFPELETRRLLLRKITLHDASEIFFLRSNEAVMKYIDRERAKSVKEAEDFIKKITNNILSNDGIVWSIDLKENPGKMIGTVCLWQFEKEHFRAETGYVLHPDHWRKGYMKEVLEKVLDFGFDTLKLHSIEAHIAPANIASATLLESTGFIREAYFKENFYFRGNFLDTAVYSKLKN